VACPEVKRTSQWNASSRSWLAVALADSDALIDMFFKREMTQEEMRDERLIT
jgi:hypothetical protein